MTTHNQTHAAEGDPPLGHVSSMRQLVSVFVTLLLLTAITVAAAQIDLGAANIWIALGIAAIKGSLVVLFFMHLRYDSPFYGVVFASALVFVALFIALTLMDRATYEPELIEGYAPAIEQAQ